MSNETTPGERLYAIVEQGLCIGCGLCQSIAGSDSIRVSKTVTGYLQPVVTGELDHATVDRIYAACPGTRVEGLPERLLEADTKQDNVWGPWRRMVRGWAGDPEVRFEGSTGGVLTALGVYLLESKRVDFILQVKTSASEPSFGEATLSFSAVDVIEASDLHVARKRLELFLGRAPEARPPGQAHVSPRRCRPRLLPSRGA